MSTDDAAPGERGKRVRDVRDRWRKADQAARDEAAPDPAVGGAERRADSLGSLDRIREDSPESDIETRRALDQVEREIERSRKEPG